MKTLCILMTAACLMGCAAPKMNTASGRPEISVKASRADVKTALTGVIIDRQYLVVEETETMVRAEGDTSAAAAFWFTDLRSGEKPKTILIFNMVENSGVTRVVGIAKLYRPYYKSELDYTNPNVNAEVQWLLDCVAADAEHRARPAGPEPVKVTASRAGKQP